jgi:hypothetical protein
MSQQTTKKIIPGHIFFISTISHRGGYEKPFPGAVTKVGKKYFDIGYLRFEIKNLKHWSRNYAPMYKIWETMTDYYNHIERERYIKEARQFFNAFNVYDNLTLEELAELNGFIWKHKRLNTPDDEHQLLSDSNREGIECEK